MASTTANATMAAAGFDKRSSNVSSLQTPASGSFPSEMLSPMAASPLLSKKDDLKTPITPPSAYLDFLKNMSPAMLSPAPTSNSSHFSFNGKQPEKPSDRASESASEKPSISPPMSQPALSRNTSYDSTNSTTTTSTDQSATSYSRTAGSPRGRPESPRVIIPPSSFARPASKTSRTPRLYIPQSPFSPALTSAQSGPSFSSTTPLSAAPWSASFSPREHANSDAISKPGKVSVRQVVTRTVTYCRTPLEPAPKGKRRKIEVEEASESVSTASSSPPHEPAIKEEKPDDTVAVADVAATGQVDQAV